jgi:type I restriction enzyme S subunit
MTFEDVLEIKNGKNQRAVENPNGKYPIYGSGGIMGYADDYICNANTVIIGRKGNINKPIFVDEPFWNVDTAFGLEAKRELLLPRYLYYFCLRYDFEHLNKAVTIPSLTKADLLKINIDIPKIDTQTTIVDRLGKIEQIISFRNNQLRLLENLIKARFVELFGDPVSNPKGWEKKALSEEAEIRIGPFGSLLHKEDYIIGGHALINPSHIVNGKITPDDKLTISDEKYDELSAYHLKKGDVVMGRRGEMGRCAVVEQAGL